MHTGRYYTLSASCPDGTGIVAAVSNFFAKHQGWILETANHSEPSINSGQETVPASYFMRMEIKADSLPFSLAELRNYFSPIADSLNMEWRITDSATKKRLVIFVSKQEHCLYDLLARWKSSDLDVEIACVISNHDSLRDFVEWHGIPFHHVPVTPENRTSAFNKMQDIFEKAGGDCMVLARYMQILPPEYCTYYSGRIINIHHSFLPSFIGAKPYHQAYQRGVKLIGATCHYVTQDLDQGPIIDQDVIRIDHSDSIEDMVRYGKDIEKSVLARGLRYHIEDRVLIHGNKTVVFR